MNLPTRLKARLPESWSERIALLLETLQHWPWLDTLRTLRLRFREDHLGLTASSLTFTTLISLVPLVTVTLAVFSAFPMFASFQVALQKYFLQSLVPDGIAKPVMGALTQFAAKASRLGSVGLVFLGFSALALMLTIDRTLNAIWRVRNPRPIAQRVLVYWAAATLGPLVLGISLSLTSYVLSASRGIVAELPGGVSLLLNTIEFALLAGGMAALYHYVPNTAVRWRHAIAGGVFVAIGFELAKKGLAWYLAKVPTFAVVYGAFATLPILLVWIYLGWVIVLLGAVIAAYAPSLQMRVARWPDRPGARLGLALALLAELARARQGEARGLSLAELSETLRVDPLQAEPIVDALVEMDWLGRLDEADAARHVLLVDPAATPAAPLLAQMLLEPSPELRAFRERAGFDRLTLAELLPG
ncbi:YihY family inner membrane protein [Piscinibacter sp.]|uniref:YihY family inner membrane protein n=1 Tax=Piscinibacter sp. TaxID=1903157 RepID=UPI0039E53455